MSALEQNGQRGQDVTHLTSADDARQMIEVARDRGIPTVWDRLAAQEPHDHRGHGQQDRQADLPNPAAGQSSPPIPPRNGSWGSK